MAYRVGILASHPIQYLSPFFRLLAEHVDLMVFYAHRQTNLGQANAGFGVAFEWDVDLLDGYEFEFLENVSRTPGTDHYSGCDTPGITEKLRTGRFDIFIVNGWYLKSFWQAVNACKKCNVPVLARGDSQLNTPRSWLKKVIKAIAYRALLSRFDGFLSVGQRNREYLKHYGVPDSKIFFVPHIVDNTFFATRALQSGRLETLDSLGVKPGFLSVLFVGKFIEEKRPLDVVHSIGELKKLEPSLKIEAIFVGSGALEEELRKEAENCKVPVVFTGFKNQTELPVIYAAVNLLILPSASETWGLVVNESMACGTPAVVSSAVGCGPDLVVAGKTGDIFPVGSVLELANSIKRCIELKSSTETQQALEKRMKIYSVENAVNGILNAVNVLCSKD